MSPLPRTPLKKGQNCRICNEPDSDTMVQCDKCDAWQHFSCANVTEEIAEHHWECKECADGGKPDEVDQLKAELEKMRIKKELLQERVKLARELKALEDEEKNLQPDNLENGGAGSTASTHTPPFPSAAEPIFTSAALDYRTTTTPVTQAHAGFQLPQLPTPVTSFTGTRSAFEQPVNQIVARQTVSQSQLVARQVIARDLPLFDGKPEDWPVFVSSFRNSTNTCGFTNDENLLRLQRAIKGNAYDKVRVLLTLPANVPFVIQRLEDMFGRPDLIIESQLERIRRLPAPKQERLETIMDFGIAVHNLITTMEAANLRDHLRDPTLMKELVARLPPSLKLAWASHKRSVADSDLSTFAEWMNTLAMDACSVYTAPNEPVRLDNKQRRINMHQESLREDEVESSSDKRCIVCESSCKAVGSCQKFLNLDRNQRWNLVKDKHLCRACLGRHRGNCDKECGVQNCQFRHHKLLHNYSKGSNPATSDMRHQVNSKPQRKEQGAVPKHDGAQMSHRTDTSQTLFRVIPVVLQNDDKRISTFAFLDDGSSVTLIDDDIAKALDLEGPVVPLCLRWTGNTTRDEVASQRLTVSISGTTSNAKTYRITSARTVRNLDLPRQTMDVAELAGRFSQLEGLPIESYRDATPKILIGLDNWRLGAPLRIKEGTEFEPIAIKCRLGWTAYGQYGAANAEKASLNFHVCNCPEGEKLYKLIQESYAIDNIGIKKSDPDNQSDEERRALEILEMTTTRVGDRYQTGLLWAKDEIQLPDSRPMALKRLGCLERKLAQDPEMKANMHAQMDEYLRLGYARKLTPNERATRTENSWYLPIFLVKNHNKPGKVRMVMDSAAKVDGISLNSTLLKGPDLLPPMTLPLHRFREKKVAICGDIKHMFHQILIRPEDQAAQRFLWREDSKGPAEEYVMQRMTFGATCSPSSAQFVKNKNAKEFELTHPNAAKVIIEQTYADDSLASCDNPAEAIQLAKDVCYVNSQAGFEVRNWKSNDASVREALEAADDQASLALDVSREKILGMWWDPNTDSFTYSLKYSRIRPSIWTGEEIPTKRDVLRVLMSIFDPKGFLSYYTVHLKIILQNIWRAGGSWDDPIPEEAYLAWRKWVEKLPEVERLSIPRCYLQQVDNYDGADVQLHTFCDAGEEACCATIYLRIEKEGQIDVAQVGAKVKVAPLKPLSIPRLELQAALIGARYAAHVKACLTINIDSEFYWSDSETALSWLRSDQRRYKPFVAFRVTEIQELTNVEDWYGLASGHNVADEATKSSNVPNNDGKSRWFKGAAFLKDPQSTWPIRKARSSPTTQEEIRVAAHHSLATELIDASRFSKWQRLHRAVAYVHRFIQQSKRVVQHHPVSLSSDQLQQAELTLFAIAQQREFANEIRILSGKNPQLPKTSALYKLSAFVSEDGLLRMDSRLTHAPVPSCTKQPIILPRGHRITYLLIRFYHEKMAHQHHETVVNEVRKRYYVTKLRVLVKQVTHECQKCCNDKAVPQIPRMATLPQARLTPFTPPFTYTGLDFFGPMDIVDGRKPKKRWGMLATCLVSRAVHVEVVHSLSTSSCIMAIRKFASIRGMPKEIYSDCGTNFVGAERVLREELKNLDTHKLAEEFVTSETTWRFNPPAAPHMGGAWERMVKSIKRATYGALPKRHPSDEVLSCALALAADIVNSRPLTYLPMDSPESDAITPNHLLRYGAVNGSITALSDDPEVLQNTWKAAEQIANRFWHRWLNEYLPEVMKRTKWHEEVKPIKVGDMVIVADPSAPRNSWPKGMVQEVLKAADGRVRQVILKTARGTTLKRPVAKVVVIPVASMDPRSNDGGEDVTKPADVSQHNPETASGAEVEAGKETAHRT